MKAIKKLFRKKGASNSCPEYANEVYYQSTGKAVWSSRNYKQFAGEAYIRNVIAHRCIKLIAGGASSVSWKLFYSRDNKTKELTKHPLLELLSCPNPLTGTSEFFEKVYSYRLISGNSYLLAVGASDESPNELYALRPDRVEIIAGENGIPRAYRYKLGNDHKDYQVDRITGRSQVLHLKEFHPLNDWYGLSSIEAASYSIDQHNQAGSWNQALLQNGARPSGALVVKGSDNNPGCLNDEQFLRLKNQIDDHYIGALNVGRPILLEGGLEWKEMSLSPKDMDFINTKNSAARDIALSFGVPPQMLGIPGDNTYSNMAEARLSLWEQTILPLLENITSSLNNWLVPMFDEYLKLKFDIDSISALSPRREAVWKRIKTADFLSDDEKKLALGIGH